MESARTKLSNVFEGWTKWQIATAVGAPIALGLAGLWFYNRSKRKTANKTNDRLTTDEVSKTSTSSASSTQDAEKPNMPKVASYMRSYDDIIGLIVKILDQVQLHF